MNIENLKDVADQIILKGRMILQNDGYLEAMIFAVSNDGSVTPVSFSTDSDKDKDDAADLMREMARVSSAIITLMDTYVLEVSEEEKAKIAGSIADHPQKMEAICCAIYKPKQVVMKKILYVKKDKEYGFFDTGWDEMKDMAGSRFSNPFDSC